MRPRSRLFDFTGGILTIPPGFTRGLDFGPLADDAEGGLLDEEEEVEVTPIYRPMLDLTNDSKATAVLVSFPSREDCSVLIIWLRSTVDLLHPRPLNNSTLRSRSCCPLEYAFRSDKSSLADLWTPHSDSRRHQLHPRRGAALWWPSETGRTLST